MRAAWLFLRFLGAVDLVVSSRLLVQPRADRRPQPRASACGCISTGRERRRRRRLEWRKETTGLLAKGFVLQRVLVDDSGVTLDELFQVRAVRAKLGVLFHEFIVGADGVGWRRGAAGVAGQALEVVAKIGVFVRDHPVFDGRFDGEPDYREVAGGADGCAG